MTGFTRRTAVDEVRRRLRERLAPLAAESVPVTDCSGRILAKNVVAPVDVPGFDRAAMDGYALVGEDTFGAAADSPLQVKLIGESLPGGAFTGAVNNGEAVRIMTGAPIPPGANAVLPAESADEDGETVWVRGAVPPGKHVGRRAEDVQAGQTVLSAGRRLRPQDAGLVASVGLSAVSVVRRPRVELLITGDELLPPGEMPSPGRIVDSNSVMLEALLRRDGGVPAATVRVQDSETSVRAALGHTEGDVVLVSGGSSVGQEDHAPSVLAALGELTVHGIAIRPASPTGVGFLPPLPGESRPRPTFLLPGNPVSCLCAYDFFAGPAIRLLGGRRWRWPYRARTLPLARKITSQLGRVDYLRVRIGDDGVEPLSVGGASILSSTVRADGFVVVGSDEEGYPAGAQVEVFLYDDPRGATEASR